MQARYYDPVMGRFYSNDPVGAVSHMSNAEGIKGFNRYSYAVNNPYKYSDPDGRKIEVVGTEEYVAIVNAQVDVITASDPVLNTMITELRDSNHVHFIGDVSNNPSGNTGNANVTTGHSPNESVEEVGTSSVTFFDPLNAQGPNDIRPPIVGLTHELKHASDKDKGLIDRTLDANGVPKHEKRAMDTENKMRNILGVNERDTTIYH